MARADDIALVWFRRDLRLDDNPAWAAATAASEFVVALYVLDDRELAEAGPFRRRQLVANLQAFDFDVFERTRGRLVVRTGDPLELVPDTVQRLACTAAYWNAEATPYARERDAWVAARLEVPVHRSWGGLVLPPGAVATKKGRLPKVFSAFHRTWKTATWDDWPDEGESVVYPEPAELIPRLDAPAPIPEGEDEAKRRLAELMDAADDFDERALGPVADLVDRVAVDLHFGLISPRMVFLAVGDESPGRVAVLRRLARRDWFAHVLEETDGDPRELDQTADGPVDGGTLPPPDPGRVAAWKGGFTGYPIVDAAMRQLRQTGWLPDRLRPLVASFLVRHLLVDWRVGEQHLSHLLVDGDVAQSIGVWRQAAGEGPDAVPDGRVPNPVEESRKLDPEGAYVARWVPELAPLEPADRHAPWLADPDRLRAAGVVPGDTYPVPIVDHDEARRRWVAGPATPVI